MDRFVTRRVSVICVAQEDTSDIVDDDDCDHTDVLARVGGGSLVTLMFVSDSCVPTLALQSSASWCSTNLESSSLCGSGMSFLVDILVAIDVR